jgi:hypothetical protein
MDGDMKASGYGGEKPESLNKRLEAFVATLAAEAKRRVDRRTIVESRWIEDLQQYHGIYNETISKRLEESKSSQIFMNMTAPKTDTLIARLFDLLFPTDDKNWSIGPTPVPELTKQAEEAMANLDRLTKEADQLHEQSMAAAEGGAPAAEVQGLEAQKRGVEEQEKTARAAHDALQATLDEASRRAELMEKEIADQLQQCGAPAQARMAISDGCKIGFGVVKGPVSGGRGRRKWVSSKDPKTGAPVYELQFVQNRDPGMHWVDPWSYYPDPDSQDVANGRGDFERHLMTSDQLRRLTKERDDIDKDVVREILSQKPSEGMPAYKAQINTITNSNDSGLNRNLYHVWEYTGPVETEDMNLLAMAFMPDSKVEVDVLTSYYVKVWFCQGKVLSFALHPLDSNDCIYSVFTVRPDEASPFGYGIPWIVRNPQVVFNAAFRMMMDNSALSTGPQIVVTQGLVHPQDGDWTLTPRKIWIRDQTKSVSGVPAFESFNIDSNQNELANIIGLARDLHDEISGMPAIAQGEQGTGVTKTAQGMALLMNSANVIFRRMVRLYDDNVIIPMITRFYHWNMQFSKKDNIKGDYEVAARGSGVLLVREMLANNLLMIAQIFGDHPVYGQMIKSDGLLRAIFRANMIPVDEILKSEREYRKDKAEADAQRDPAAAAAQAAAEAKIEEVKVKREEVEAQTARVELEWSTRERIAQMSFDAGMNRLAEMLNMDADELEEKKRQFDAKQRQEKLTLAAEIALQRETGTSSGGSV